MFGCLLVFLGCALFVVSFLGLLRFPTVLGRIHAAGIGETLAPFLVFAGLLILRHDGAYIAKIGCILAFLWITSPVASHLIGRMAAEEELGGESDEAS